MTNFSLVWSVYSVETRTALGVVRAFVAHPIPGQPGAESFGLLPRGAREATGVRRSLLRSNALRQAGELEQRAAAARRSAPRARRWG